MTLITNECAVDFGITGRGGTGGNAVRCLKDYAEWAGSFIRVRLEVLGGTGPIVECAQSFVPEARVFCRRKQHHVGESLDPAECPFIRRRGNAVSPGSCIDVETICVGIGCNQAKLRFMS